MYFDYIVKEGGARFADLKVGVFPLQRRTRETSGLDAEKMFTRVAPSERYIPKTDYILSDGTNTLHLEFNDRGRVVGATSYSTNRVSHMIGSIGKQVITPAGAP